MPTFYTDGSWDSRTKHGGWAYVRVLGSRVLRVGTGSVRNTTNNRMEATAIIEAVESVRGDGKRIRVFTDSMYCVRVGRRVALGFRGFALVPNGDLWQRFARALGSHSILFTHVRGHVGVEFNELADRLAGEAYRLAKAGHPNTIEDVKGDAPEGRPRHTLADALL